MIASIVDVLFPPRCAACRELLPPTENASVLGDLCAVCESTLEPIDDACLRCGLPGEALPECASCRAHPPAFDSAHSALLYGAAIADMLHRYKYEDHSALARPLGLLVAALDLPAPDVVIPIPLHASRRRSRTYDQALYLARVIARARGWRFDSQLLARVRPTQRQVGQTRDARAQNMLGAFQASPAVQGLRVLLVDDVVTTGATASECARALKTAGARWVAVASVARTA